MHLVFDIFQGMGIAAAVGIRPFLPAVAAGGLAAADAEIDFKGTDYSFLQSPWFLLGLAIAAIVVLVLERRLPAAQIEKGPLAIALGVISVGLGALFFAGSLCRGGYAVWPGFIGGAVCALIAIAATRPLLARVRSRLDEAAAAIGPPLIAELTAILTAVLSILAPPVGLIAVLALLWLAIAGRGRGEQKYAGLRILR
jgi:hypothetical protein